jgi:predicted CXXCH cytochrome family protein
MPSSFREPKSLSESLQLDYYRRPRGIRRLRSRLGWPTLIGCLALVGLTFWPRARFVYEAHPVSPAHALFNDNCEVCHEKSFTPALRLINSSSAMTSVDNQTCVKCHEGPPHQDPERLADSTRCATCHPEHRGKTEMARVSDRRCADCHEDLSKVVQDPRVGKATAFTESGHPDFRKIDQTGSKINFNHKLHLGLPRQKSLRDANSPAMMETMKRMERDSCQFCHKTDAAGEYMRPINYEEHCKVCHPLNVFLFDQSQNAETLAFMQLPAPHKEPAVVRDSLRQRLVEFLQTNGPKHAEATPTASVLPQFSPRTPMEDRSDWVRFQLGGNESLLFAGANGCRYCHVVERPFDSESGRLPQYANSGIVNWWYKSSRFSHRSHQMLECSQCHDAEDSGFNQVATIPGKALCLQCHEKDSRPWKKERVRSDCVDCHRYHKHSGQDFKGTFTISDCTRPR